MSSPEETNAGPVIRDLRRIDPRTGQVRNPGGDAPGTAARGSGKPGRPARHSESAPGTEETAGAGAGPASGGAGPAAEPEGSAEAELATKLAERTADLQRVSAEYANYRKRVDRDRLVVREQALANVLVALLPVLDDIGRAKEHGELVGGFEKVAQSLESIVTKLGLVAFGNEGEPFDPNVHEAVASEPRAGVAAGHVAEVSRAGYRVGERLIRPAQVVVAAEGEPPSPGQPSPTVESAPPEPGAGERLDERI